MVFGLPLGRAGCGLFGLVWLCLGLQVGLYIVTVCTFVVGFSCLVYLCVGGLICVVVVLIKFVCWWVCVRIFLVWLFDYVALMLLIVLVLLVLGLSGLFYGFILLL